MNKVIVSFSFCVLTILASCSILDVEPKTSWSATDFPSELVHLQGLVRGGYARIGNALIQNFVIYGDERADVYYCNDGTQPNHDRIVRSQLDVNMGAANWQPFFQVVNQANVVIHYTPDMIRDGTVSAASANPLLGQAYCQRAFAYFWLIRIWGDVPIVDRPLLNSEESIDVPRSPVPFVLNMIHNDLDSALKYIPAQTTVAQLTRTSFSPVAARAIKAHAYMWNHQYEQALEQLDLAIPTTTTLYRLANLHDPLQIPADNAIFRTWVATTEFSKMFNNSGPSTNPESIFELNYSSDDGHFNQWFDNFWTSGVPYFMVREEFRGIFQNNDFRLHASIGAVSGGKFRATKWVTGYVRNDARNVLLIRLADLKLLRSEARVMLIPEGSDPTNEQREEIMSDVNDISLRARGAAYESSSYLDHDAWKREDFVNTIKRERRLEMAFEGQRWFDLARWGDTVDALAAMVESNTNYVFYNGPVYLNPKAIVWPVHLVEIRRSKYIEQNEFYK